MASADVFKDIHANSANISNNTTSTTVPLLDIKNEGTGDTMIIFRTGAEEYVMGMDNSQSGDPFIIQNATALSTGVGLYIDNGSDVGIGQAPTASAILDITSTTKAFYPPRMTTTQRNTLSGTAATGAIIFNTTTGKLEVFTTAGFESITSTGP